MSYSLFSVKPIAKKKIMDSITNGVLVVNINQVIVGFNPAISSFFMDSGPITIGNKVSTLFQQNSEIITQLEVFEKRVFEIRNYFNNRQRII